MDNALYYLAVNRQTGLSLELDTVANNVANMNTIGFRREGMTFTEFVLAAEVGESVSMGDLGARYASEMPGALVITGGELDLAIEGRGYFMIQDEDGVQLTRAGAFQTSPDGILVTPSGQEVLDVGRAPIFIPPQATSLVIGTDGTISANGEPIGQVGVVDASRELVSRSGNTAFTVEDDAFEPVAFPRVRQGALEGSNVDAVSEISRLIEITRAYETAQSLVEDEDDRIRNAIQTLGSDR